MELLVPSTDEYPNFATIRKSLVDEYGTSTEKLVVFKYKNRLRVFYLACGCPMFDFYLAHLTPDGLEFFSDYKLYREYKAEKLFKFLDTAITNEDYEAIESLRNMALDYISGRAVITLGQRFRSVVEFAPRAMRMFLLGSPIEEVYDYYVEQVVDQ